MTFGGRSAAGAGRLAAIVARSKTRTRASDGTVGCFIGERSIVVVHSKGVFRFGRFTIRHPAPVRHGFHPDARLHADGAAVDVAARARRGGAVERVAEPRAGVADFSVMTLPSLANSGLPHGCAALLVEPAVGIVLHHVPREALDDARLLGREGRLDGEHLPLGGFAEKVERGVPRQIHEVRAVARPLWRAAGRMHLVVEEERIESSRLHAGELAAIDPVLDPAHRERGRDDAHRLALVELPPRRCCNSST